MMLFAFLHRLTCDNSPRLPGGRYRTHVCDRGSEGCTVHVHADVDGITALPEDKNVITTMGGVVGFQLSADEQGKEGSCETSRRSPVA